MLQVEFEALSHDCKAKHTQTYNLLHIDFSYPKIRNSKPALRIPQFWCLCRHDGHCAHILQSMQHDKCNPRVHFYFFDYPAQLLAGQTHEFSQNGFAIIGILIFLRSKNHSRAVSQNNVVCEVSWMSQADNGGCFFCLLVFGQPTVHDSFECEVTAALAWKIDAPADFLDALSDVSSRLASSERSSKVCAYMFMYRRSSK